MFSNNKFRIIEKPKLKSESLSKFYKDNLNTTLKEKVHTIQVNFFFMIKILDKQAHTSTSLFYDKVDFHKILIMQFHKNKNQPVVYHMLLVLSEYYS